MPYKPQKLSEPIRLPQKIAKLLTESIRDGTFLPGSGLPSEKQISDDFSVSRSVVREAVSILKYDGLVETKQGAGIYVSDNPFAGPFRIDNDFSPSEPKDLSQLFQLRLYVESAAAELAAGNVDTAIEEKMEGALSGIMKAIESGRSDSTESVDADLEFHNLVSEASGNHYLFNFVQFINAKLRESVRAGRKNSSLVPNLPQSVFNEHLEIFDAIKCGSPERARKAMEQHIRNSANRLKLTI